MGGIIENVVKEKKKKFNKEQEVLGTAFILPYALAFFAFIVIRYLWECFYHSHLLT